MSMTPFYNQSSLQPFGRDPFFDTSFTPSSFSLMNRTPTDIAVQNPSMRPFAPLLSADLIESDTDYHVHCDLPGVERADLDITMNDGVLTIRAERKEVHEIDTDTAHRVERNFGKIQRSITIPRNADLSQASANLKDGVLRVSFPKINTGNVTKLLVE